MSGATKLGASHPRATFQQLSSFVLVSGIGWLIDTGVYATLVALDVRVALAGIFGGICGASFAFISSSRFVFTFSGRALTWKMMLYLIYTLLLITVAALAMDLITSLLTRAATAASLTLSLTGLALVAKCLVTPLLLASNFLVSRYMLHGA